jgi:hypothetical protein
MSHHTRTIHGEPWQPCPQCPRRGENGGDETEGVCPSRRHPAYCQHAGERWIAWRDKIRNEPKENRPGREPETPPEPPAVPLLRKAANLAGAVVEHVKTGRQKASPDVQAARLEICRVCENYRASDQACGGMTGCGCYLPVKVSWAEQRCPLDKWPTP